jgi:hypothetical protein
MRRYLEGAFQGAEFSQQKSKIILRQGCGEMHRAIRS